MATSSTKVDIEKCTTQTLYKTMAKIREEVNDKAVLDSKRKPHAVSIMAGVEIDPNADEFQKWYRRFKSMPGSVIPQIQGEIN